MYKSVEHKGFPTVWWKMAKSKERGDKKSDALYLRKEVYAPMYWTTSILYARLLMTPFHVII